MRTPRRTSQRNAWLIAWALTLALHAGGVVGFRRLPPPHAISTAPARPEPVRLVFSRSGPESRRSEAPHFFTELPPDRADTRPENADFLSNVTSRARDQVPGGDAALPRMQGESDAPMVNLEPDQATARPPANLTPPVEPANPGISEFQQPGGARSRGKLGFGAAVSPARPARDATPDASPGSAGNSDIHQPEMDNPGGNAALSGEVSLNTTAWDYAPWLQRFGRQLMSRWVAPPAYYMGLLKEGGWALVEAEISRSGELLRLDLLEERGHPALSLAAQGAVRSTPPIEPLPADFPEPTLILRIRMVYPRVRSR
jgi:hypothetical protein